MNLTVADVSFGNLWSKTFAQIINSPAVGSTSCNRASGEKFSKLEDIVVLSNSRRIHDLLFKCVFGTVPGQEMCWQNTEMIYLGCFWWTLCSSPSLSSCACGVSHSGRVGLGWDSQCFPSNPLVSNKVQQAQLWPSLLQLFILRNVQSKSSSGPAAAASTGCRVKFHKSVH